MSASRILTTPIIDRTGLTGLWSYTFAYQQIQPLPSGVQQDQVGPSLTTALKEELGLKLQSDRGAVDIVVIESVQPPTED